MTPERLRAAIQSNDERIQKRIERILKLKQFARPKRIEHA